MLDHSFFGNIFIEIVQEVLFINHLRLRIILQNPLDGRFVLDAVQNLDFCYLVASYSAG